MMIRGSALLAWVGLVLLLILVVQATSVLVLGGADYSWISMTIGLQDRMCAYCFSITTLVMHWYCVCHVSRLSLCASSSTSTSNQSVHWLCACHSWVQLSSVHTTVFQCVTVYVAFGYKCEFWGIPDILCSVIALLIAPAYDSQLWSRNPPCAIC